MELSPQRQLRKGQLPKMVSWYDPRLLARIGVHTIVSSVFGQYADQRLMQAVTDPAADQDLVALYDYSDPNAGEPHKCLACDDSGAFWIDYIADVGDGFDCTYTMAYLLGQDSLDVRGAGNLRHGEVLIMGGDLCGKAMVPLVESEPGRWTATWFGKTRKLKGEAAAKRLERLIRMNGQYPVRVLPDEQERLEQEIGHATSYFPSM